MNAPSPHTRPSAAPARPEPAAPEAVFFIVGTGRCGTTLLQSMLSASPDIAIPPETHFFLRFDPKRLVGDPIGDNQIDAYVRRVRDTPYFDMMGLDSVKLETAVQAGARGARDLFLWFSRSLLAHPTAGADADGAAAARFLGEKTPSHGAHIGRILDVLPEAKFIHMHRDPRDVVASLLDAEFWGHTSVRRTARRCRGLLETLVAWERRLPSAQFTTLRYESLVDEPEAELRRMCAFIGAPFDKRMLEHHAHRREGRRYLDAEASWKSLSDQPLQKSRVGRYRQRLTDRQIRAVERAIGPALMARFGYEVDSTAKRRPWWPLLDFVGEQAGRLGREAKRAAARATGRRPRRAGVSTRAP